MRDLLNIIERIEAASASLRILAMNLDTGTPTDSLWVPPLNPPLTWREVSGTDRKLDTDPYDPVDTQVAAVTSLAQACAPRNSSSTSLDGTGSLK